MVYLNKEFYCIHVSPEIHRSVCNHSRQTPVRDLCMSYYELVPLHHNLPSNSSNHSINCTHLTLECKTTSLFEQNCNIHLQTHAKFSDILVILPTSRQQVVFALFVPCYQQVIEQVVNSCNNPVDTVRLAATLFQQVWYTHDITILLQPCNILVISCPVSDLLVLQEFAWELRNKSLHESWWNVPMKWEQKLDESW